MAANTLKTFSLTGLLATAATLLGACPTPPSGPCGHRVSISLDLAGEYPAAGLEFTFVDGVKEHPVRDCIPGSGDNFEIPCDESLEANGLIYGYHDEFNDPLPTEVTLGVHIVGGSTLLSETFAPQFALETDGIDAECLVAHRHVVVPLP